MNSIEKAMNKQVPTAGLAVSAEPLFTRREHDLAGLAATTALTSTDTVEPPKQCTKRTITLNLERLCQRGLLVPDTQRSHIREEYRHIKRPLLMNAAGKGATVAEYANVIMVTSPNPGEGKTFTASNLALSIATERDRTVLLVDADLVRPSINKLFDFEAKIGLVDYLIKDNLQLSEVLLKTNIPSLTILPAGSSHHLSTELLASGNMCALVQEISKQYSDRIIIFDSPPLLATSEASILASLVGQVVMVVEAEKTRQSQVKEALALLDANTIVGFVLNKSRGPLADCCYGYGYSQGGYGQSSYGYSSRQ